MKPSSSSARTPWRVVHVLFSSRMAGSERYCVDLARQQAALGHEVHVVGLPGSPMAQAVGGKVRFHGMRFPLMRGLRLRRLIDAVSPDLCHAHLSPACKALASAPAHVGTVATLHVGYKPHQHGHMHGLVCVNQAQFGRLESYAGHKRVVSNWLPELSSPTAAGRHQQRAALGIKDNTLLVGAVGRLDASKGMDVLISAFRAFAPENAALVIVGEGSQRPALEKLCAGDARVRLIGFREDVASVLGAMDLFVSPSREETFGLAILEAMAFGLPMIATATEGPSEILRGEPAELVEPGSVQALGLALARSLAGLQVGGARRVAYDLRPFEPATSVGSINDFYQQVMQDLARRAPALNLHGAHASHV